jgi:hypothetical protein
MMPTFPSSPSDFRFSSQNPCPLLVWSLGLRHPQLSRIAVGALVEKQRLRSRYSVAQNEKWPSPLEAWLVISGHGPDYFLTFAIRARAADP